MRKRSARRETSGPVEAPEDAADAAVAARRRALDRQTVMAIAGLVAVSAFLTVYPNDHERTIAGLKAIAPWLIGLSVLIVVANRATLHVQTKAIRKEAGAGR
ncbi:hypothetical protein IHQ68_12390 [Chelatococcus sambhunathii]|uniref:Integral membrane protein n=1 Tax=Chelatococcus sambhunathii TaxID=363953 RepID=A0ABU1DHN9_9HYPH|nr:hypothetical protein [Chelatococcus sambhunathii]MDR4307415.1 hypothetical protein [Chelatococcus sambhunathii]